jgi:uncharacterized membrane protein
MLIAILTAIHILGVVIWIGGVAFVTMIVFPMILRMESSLEKMLFFQGIEHRFAKIAKNMRFISWHDRVFTVISDRGMENNVYNQRVESNLYVSCLDILCAHIAL